VSFAKKNSYSLETSGALTMVSNGPPCGISPKCRPTLVVVVDEIARQRQKHADF